MKINKKGISLIVLVITIIVAIILATAIILSLSGGEIIDEANKALSASDLATQKEIIALKYAEYDLDMNLGIIDASTSAEEYIKNILIEDETYTEEQLKRVYITNRGGISVAPLPEGFAYSSLETEDEISEGLVIYEGKVAVTNTDSNANGIIDDQENRNQFVWIPVPDINEFKVRNGYTWNQAIQTYGSVPFEEYIMEPSTQTRGNVTLSATNDVTGEYAEYAAMMESVKKYGGFYIARYEAGKETIEGQDLVVSKRGKNVWNNIQWGVSTVDIGTDGIVIKSRSMYNEKAYKSHLLYGVQWDAIVNWLKDDYVWASQNLSIEKNGSIFGNLKNYNDAMPTSKDIALAGTLLTTGYSDFWKQNNIYDIIGNVYEWTMEAHQDGQRVYRGGSYSDTGWGVNLSNRGCGNGVGLKSDSFGFRVGLIVE